jgi:hypothetical protein
MKKYLTSSVIKEMQIKTILRFHLFPGKKTNKSQMLVRIVGGGEKEPLYTAHGMQISSTTIEFIWVLLRKIKHRVLCDPDIPLLVMYLKETESTFIRVTYHDTIHNSQVMTLA